MRRRIHLLGPFAAFHDGPIEIESATIFDAIEAVSRQTPGFQPDPIHGRKVIQVLGFDNLDVMKTYDTTTEDIYILPPLVFGKNGGLIQSIVGVVLIVVGFFVSAAGYPQLGLALMAAGISMTVGGVMQMLSPQPQLGSGDADAKRSKYLSNSQNTVAIGTPIALIYGRRRHGGQILSINIDAKDALV